MSKKTAGHETAEQHVKAIRRAARKQYSAEEKIRIVLEGLREEHVYRQRLWDRYSAGSRESFCSS